MRIVDAHLHVWLGADERPLQPLSTFRHGAARPVELLLAEMAAAGVEQAVLVQPSSYGYDHGYLLECLARYPGKLAGVGLVDPKAPDAADRARRLDAAGIHGLRLYPRAEPDPAWLDSPASDPLWETAAELRMPICLFMEPRHAGRLARMVERHPETPVVVDHLSRPDPTEGPPYAGYRPILDLARFPNVHLKLSGIPAVSREPYPYRDVWPLVRLAYAAFGPRRLLWATDFPHILERCGYCACLELTTRVLSFLDPAHLPGILGGTARRLWARALGGV